MSRTSQRRTRTSQRRALKSRRFIASLCLSLAALLCFVAEAEACTWDYLIWMPRSKNADPLYRFVRDHKAGYIDRTGKVVIEPKFDVYDNYGGEFHDGLLEVGIGSGEYVDSTGKLLGLKLSSGKEFSEGLAVALPEYGDKWGYIDRTGKFAISPRFDHFQSNFADGFAWIEVGGRYGFIDRTGEFVVAPTFLWGADFSDGMARVVVDGPCRLGYRGPCGGSVIIGDAAGREDVPHCKVTFVDRYGSVLEGRFDEAKDFSEGLAPVRKGDKWGYIDKSGRTVIGPRFDDAWPFSSGRARVKQEGLYGYIDKRGEVVIPSRFEDAEDFSEGFAVVAGEGRNAEGSHTFYYIDRDGRAAIRGPFYVASHFFKGLAHVQFEIVRRAENGVNWMKRRFAYINTKGKTVFAYEYEVEG